jgi:F-type H+-transporting ATPase subunit a
MADKPDTGHLMGHVKDSTYFEVPTRLGGKLELPQPFHLDKPLFDVKIGVPHIDSRIEPFDLKITKFMALEVLAAAIIVVIFTRLAQRMAVGGPPRGRFWNLFESMLVFIRDEVARPAIGKHDADRFLPLLWTMFFFVLVCNLLGLVPWLGSATGALATTGALAVVTFLTVIGSGMAKLGVVGFWQAQVPHMELPLVMAIFLKPMIFLIEVIGLAIKHFVLAMRLLANMLAGHLVLAVVMGFVALTWHTSFVYFVAPASIFGSIALSMLELLVAFIQAYIFTFLSALFIGMAVHPH